MKSKAHIKGHPLHPILITFPIAFFTGTFIFDCLGFLYDRVLLNEIARYMLIAGLIGGAVAAIPGIIDYAFTVPPESSAKKRAVKHGVLNSIMIVLFIISLFVRGHVPPLAIIFLDLAGVLMMSVAGWLGGTLVHRNQIGVDHRYAKAGKWKEIYFKKKGESIEVANVNELQTDQMLLVHIDKKRIVLGRTGKGYVAFEDRCPHRGGSLAGGTMICGTVQCPWHGSQFDVVTGAVKAGPANCGIKTYKVEEKEGKVHLYI